MSGSIMAAVQSQDCLQRDIFRLRLFALGLGEVRPGQFVNLYLDDGRHLLPRPVSVCDVDGEELTLVYRVVGEGTAYFSRKKEGDRLRLLGPLGNGYPLDELTDKTTILAVGGGLGIPPMLYLSRCLKECGHAVRTVLGYRDEGFLLKDFSAIDVPVYRTSDSGAVGKKGTVIDCIRQEGLSAEVVFACGPLPMLRALREYCAGQGMRLYVSLEERMACGIGACLGCVCQTTEVDGHSHVHNRRVCVDGPVFEAGEVVL